MGAWGNLNASHLGIFGGNWNNTGNAGVFQFNLNQTATNVNSNVGSRQMLNKTVLLALALAKTQQILTGVLVDAQGG